MPPLLVRASDQSPERIAGRLSKFSGAWSEIGADPWVMRIVQWGYKIPFVTLPPLRLQGQETTYPKGSLKWSSLNQSVQELRNKGAIEPAPLTPGFYSRFFLVRKATGEWRPIIDLSSLNVFMHCQSFTMVIKGFHKERGFSEAVAHRLAISQRESSAGVYESKWN